MGHQGVGRRSIAKKKYKIKWVGASKGWWRVDCKKKCKIKRVGALKGGASVHGIAKQSAKSRGLGL